MPAAWPTMKLTMAMPPVTKMLAVAGPPQWLGLPVMSVTIRSLGIIPNRFKVSMKKKTVHTKPT